MITDGEKLEAEEQAELETVLDRFIQRIGDVAAWSMLVLVGVIVLQVVLRYVFSKPMVALSELQRHLYAVATILSIAYASSRGAHVRVDLIHARLPRVAQLVLSIVTQVCLVLPLAIFLAWDGWLFTMDSYRIGEGSAVAGGLPYLWVVKALIPFGLVLVILAALSRTWCSILNLSRRLGGEAAED